MEKEKTYEVKTECTNCGSEANLFIPFGITIAVFLDQQKCSFCGCEHTLRKYY